VDAARETGSQATLTGETTANPMFVPDVAGDYVAQLIVSSNVLKSAPETVLITATEQPVD
jgi:hypothetical protein